MKAIDIVEKEVARQAEFGMEPSWEDFVIAGILAGRKEVVEDLRDLWTDGAITYLDSGTFKGKKLWAVPYELWQAKLKKWGL